MTNPPSLTTMDGMVRSRRPSGVTSPHSSVPRGAGVVNRRRVLGGLGAAAVLGLAGCTEDQGTSGTGETWAGDSASDASRSASPTPTPTSTPTATDRPLTLRPGRTFAVGQPVTVAYGHESSRQFGELAVPLDLPENVTVPVLMVLHGGSWQASSTLDYVREAARSIAAYGVVTWNVEYRGIGGGGGWPNTFRDVAAAMDFVPELSPHIGRELDRERFVMMGHSAGGHLAAWGASRHVRAQEQPGGRPALRPAACVSFAGVYDLAHAHELGHRHMVDLLGGTPAQIPRVYDLASPIENIPDDVDFVCCHGHDDAVVPVTQTQRFTSAGADGGQEIDGVLLQSAGHNDWMIPGTHPWRFGQERLLHTMLDV